MELLNDELDYVVTGPRWPDTEGSVPYDDLVAV